MKRRRLSLLIGIAALVLVGSLLSGCQGEEGEPGPRGPEGPAGPQGEPGPAGEDGCSPAVTLEGTILKIDSDCDGEIDIEQDVQGPAGPQGEQGPAGPAGPKGEPGPQGEPGPAGEDGCSPAITLEGTILKIDSDCDGEIDIEQDVQGPAGPQGKQGPAGPKGEPGPQGEPGPAGEDGCSPAITLEGTILKIDSDCDGEIDIEQDVQGPAGPQGEQGLQGAQGPAGPAGPAGPQGAQGPAGPAGPAGPQGEQGPAGPQGEPGGLKGYEIVTRERAFTGLGVLTLRCPEGKQVIGGGASASSPAVSIYTNMPVGTTGWRVRALGAEAYTLTGYAICAAAE